MIFGCSHIRYSWPLSRVSGQRVGTYVACLDCGKELPYSWEQMRVVKVDKRKPVREQRAKQATEQPLLVADCEESS